MTQCVLNLEQNFVLHITVEFFFKKIDPGRNVKMNLTHIDYNLICPEIDLLRQFTYQIGFLLILFKK